MMGDQQQWAGAPGASAFGAPPPHGAPPHGAPPRGSFGAPHSGFGAPAAFGRPPTPRLSEAEVFFLSLDPFLPYVRAHSSHISP